MGTRRAKGSRRVEDKREKEMVNTKTWRDELRRQGTAFPAWGQQADSNAPKSSPFAKENNNPDMSRCIAWEAARTNRSGRRICVLKDRPSCLGPRPIRTTTFSKTVTRVDPHEGTVPLLRRRKESSESKRNTCRPSHVAQRMEIK